MSFCSGWEWPALNVWVFITQMVGHCSANAEAIGSNPFEVEIFFLRGGGVFIIIIIQTYLCRIAASVLRKKLLSMQVLLKIKNEKIKIKKI